MRADSKRTGSRSETELVEELVNIRETSKMFHAAAAVRTSVDEHVVIPQRLMSETVFKNGWNLLKRSKTELLEYITII